MPRHVYVIEIDERWIPLVAPKASPGQRCFYVGQTGLSIRRRFSRHRYGVQAGAPFRRIRRAKGAPLDRNVDVYLRRALSNRYPPAATNEEALTLERKAIDDLRAEGHYVFPEWEGRQPVTPEPAVENVPEGALTVGDFVVQELEEDRAIEGESPSGGDKLVGRATVYEVAGPDGVVLHVGDVTWPNGERSVQTTDRLESPARFDRLCQGLRLSVLCRGEQQYVELRQARMKDERWSNLFSATWEELAAGAGSDVRAALKAVGAKAVGPREDLLGDHERKRPGLCAIFDDEGDLVPLCAYVLTRIAPIHRRWSA